MSPILSTKLPQYVALSKQHQAASPAAASAQRGIGAAAAQSNDPIAHAIEELKTEISNEIADVRSSVQAMSDKVQVKSMDDIVKLVTQQEAQVDASRLAKMENLTIYGQLFAQNVLIQYIDEMVKNPTAKLRYSEMVIDKIINKIKNEQFLMAAGAMFGECREHSLAIKVFKRLRDLEPNNAINLYNLALQYEAKGMYEHAVESFKRLYESSALPPRVSLLKIAKCLENMGDFVEAAKYQEKYADIIISKNDSSSPSAVSIEGQERSSNEQEQVEVLLDLGYLQTMATQFAAANATFDLASRRFKNHSVIAYQWLVSLRTQRQQLAVLRQNRLLEIQKKEKEQSGAVQTTSVDAMPPAANETTIQQDIEKSLETVKQFMSNLQEISAVNRVLIDLCQLHISNLSGKTLKDCWSHAIEACNSAMTRDNKELVIYELTNFLYERKGSEAKPSAEFKNYAAFLLQFISQEQDIFVNNIPLWSKMRKLLGKQVYAENARSIFLVVKIQDQNQTTYRKYHLVAEKDKEEKQVQFAVDYEALVQKIISEKEISIEECQAGLELDDAVVATDGTAPFTGIYSAGPLLLRETEPEQQQSNEEKSE